MIILMDFDNNSYAINPEQVVYVRPRHMNGINGCEIQFTVGNTPVFFINSFDSVVDSLNAWRKKK